MMPIMKVGTKSSMPKNGKFKATIELQILVTQDKLKIQEFQNNN